MFFVFFIPSKKVFLVVNENLDKSPIAEKLLSIDGIDIVMIGFNFISVTKSQESEWENLLEKIRDCILSHLENDELVINLDYVESMMFVIHLQQLYLRTMFYP